MRLPRVRFRLTTMMVGVALVAVALGAERCASRRREYRQLAAYHEGVLSTLAIVRARGYYPYCVLYITGIPLSYDAKSAPLHAQCVSYHTRMLLKYERAMRFPWLAVDPDPPPPYPLPSYFDYESSR
jgi:hypothetical protein